MGASWSAQVFKQAGVTPSGPGGFLLLFFLKTWRTSSSLIWSAGVGERGVAGGANMLWREMVRTGVGGFKSTIKLIQFFSKLLIRLRAGGWCPVLGDGFRAFPHWSGVIGSELIFQLFSVGPFSHSNLLIQCVPVLIVQDSVPISLGIFFGLMKVSEFCCKPRLIIVECYISPGGNAYILTVTDIWSYRLCELVQIGGSSFKITPISKVETGLYHSNH